MEEFEAEKGGGSQQQPSRRGMIGTLLYSLGTTVLVVGGSFVLNVCFPKFLPRHWKSLAPAITWWFMCICVRRAFKSAMVLILIVHLLLAGLLLLCCGSSNRVANRAIILPAVASIVTLLISSRLPVLPLGRAVGVTLVQVWSILCGLMLFAVFPASLVSSNIAEQELRNLQLQGTVEHPPGGRVERFTVYSTDSVTLDAVVVMSAKKTRRWVAYFGGNAETMENTLKDMPMYGNLARANWLFHNPRGVGQSTGYVSWTKDLVDDADAVVHEAIKRYKIKPDKLILWGHSIGGGVAAALARRYSDMPYPLVLDRTFSSLSDAATTFSPFSPRVTRVLIKGTVGDLSVVESLVKLSQRKVLVLFHRSDDIIVYNTSSLARPAALNETGIGEDSLLELRGEFFSSPHNTPLDHFAEVGEIRQRVTELYD